MPEASLVPRSNGGERDFGSRDVDAFALAEVPPVEHLGFDRRTFDGLHFQPNQPICKQDRVAHAQLLGQRSVGDGKGAVADVI